MKRFISISLAIGIVFFALLGTDRRAWGYVDPGSGLIALQTVASVVAAYLYYIRRRLLAFFRRRKEKQGDGVLPVASKTDSHETA